MSLVRSVSRRYTVWRRRLDLDGPLIPEEGLDVWSPESGRKTPRRTVVRVLRAILRQAFEDECIAINFFYDQEDNCLRIVGYLTPPQGPDRSLMHFAPAPGCVAADALKELQWRLGVPRAPGEGPFYYRLRGQDRTAVGVVPWPLEVRIYFNDQRPEMRTKRGKARECESPEA